MSGRSPIKAGVIGWPIQHSRSPAIHGFWLNKLGIDGSYEKIAASPEDFGQTVVRLQQQGFAGLNVTIPHKQAALTLAREVDDAAQAIGAANTLIFDLKKITAVNTDAFGFMENLRSARPQWQGARAMVLGAGGAARAVLYGLVRLGFAHIHIANRTESKSKELAALFSNDTCSIKSCAWGAEPVTQVDLLVNTTSLGMTGQPSLSLSLDPLPTSALVNDLVYAPLETDLLRAARARGNPVLDGLGMLLHQARPGFEAWFGRPVEVTPELRAHIVQDLEKE